MLVGNRFGGFFCLYCTYVHLYFRFARDAEEIFALAELSVHTQLGHLFKTLASTLKHALLRNFDRKKVNRMIKRHLSYLD